MAVAVADAGSHSFRKLIFELRQICFFILLQQISVDHDRYIRSRSAAMDWRARRAIDWRRAGRRERCCRAEDGAAVSKFGLKNEHAVEVKLTGLCQFE